MKNVFFLILGVIFVLGSVFLFLQQPVEVEGEFQEIKVDQTSIKVEVRDTDEERRQGLSGRSELSEGFGMLFVFTNPDRHGFWMKDMNFSIDIIWINELLRVTGVERNASPESYPKIFFPNEPVKYALEVPAGFAQKQGIDTGSILYLE